MEPAAFANQKGSNARRFLISFGGLGFEIGLSYDSCSGLNLPMTLILKYSAKDDLCPKKNLSLGVTKRHLNRAFLIDPKGDKGLQGR